MVQIVAVLIFLIFLQQNGRREWRAGHRWWHWRRFWWRLYAIIFIFDGNWVQFECAAIQNVVRMDFVQFHGIGVIVSDVGLFER